MEKYIVKIEDISEELKKTLTEDMKSSSLHFNRKDNYFSLVGKDTKWRVDSHHLKNFNHLYPDVQILNQEEFKKRYLLSKLKGG